MSKSRPWFSHLLPLLFFAALAAAWTRPLLARIAAGTIGEGAADNFTFVWSFWWARFAAANSASELFATDYLFAPLGTSLVLHAVVPAVSVSAAVFRDADIVTLYNLSLVATLFLSAACAYAVAFRLTADSLASTLAGVAFAGAPHLLVRLLGHLNVLSAWGLPLLLLAFLGLERKPSLPAALILGGVLALVAYLDFYYAIFGGALIMLYLIAGGWSLHVAAQPLTRRRASVVRGLVVLLGLLVLTIGAILISGGTELIVGGRPVSIRSTFNPRAAAWLLGIALLVIWKAPRVGVIRAGPLTPSSPAVGARLLAAAAAAAVVLLLPLVAGAVRMIADGDYVTQRFSWRSAPGGVDLAALVLGNPLNAATGRWTQAAYRYFHIDPTEGAAWLGLVPLLILLTGFRRLRREPEARRLLIVGAVFFIWALGPYLTIAGWNSALLLPQAFFKFVPILSNARIPARALTVVLLAVALLGAIAIASVEPRKRRSLAVAALALVLLDTWPRANPVVTVEVPALYATLRAEPPGIVLELPLGTRDGFGTRGFLDHRVLLYQTVHEHPIVGGMVTRLSRRITQAYDADAILGALLDLSEGRTSTAPFICRDSLACEVRYLVVDERLASAELRAFASRTFVTEPMQQDGSRALYRMRGVRTCSCVSVTP